MRGPAGKLFSQFNQVYPVPFLELTFAKTVLLAVMVRTKADHPPVRWFESHSAIRSTPDMGAFDRQALTTRD